jgi:hypothetical protein
MNDNIDISINIFTQRYYININATIAITTNYGINTGINNEISINLSIDINIDTIYNGFNQ